MAQAFYFAYGSNLHAVDYAEYCALHALAERPLVPVGVGWIPDHRLAFTTFSRGRQGGVLDLLPAPGFVAPGAIFAIDEELDLPILDHKESTPDLYLRRDAYALDAVGVAHRVHTYEVAPARRSPFVAPPAGYLRVVREGLAAYGIDDAHIDAAAVDAPATPLALFVYGTLRRGQPAHARLHDAGARLLGAASVQGVLGERRGYPALTLVAGGGADVIPGELYALPAAPEALARALAGLDDYEDFRGHGAAGSLYTRAVVEVTLEGGGRRLAWTYLGA